MNPTQSNVYRIAQANSASLSPSVVFLRAACSSCFLPLIQTERTLIDDVMLNGRMHLKTKKQLARSNRKKCNAVSLNHRWVIFYYILYIIFFIA